MIFGKDSAGPLPDPEDAVEGAAAPGLSEQDYARTTHNTPDATSLIPAIKVPPSVPVGEVRAPASLETTGGRRRVRLTHVDPYSITRLAFVVSVTMMIVAVVAAAIFWIVLSVTGVWSQINESVASLLSDDSSSFDITDYLGFTQMVGGTLVLSGLNVVLLTVLATVGAHLYNLAAALLGGAGVTLRDD